VDVSLACRTLGADVVWRFKERHDGRLTPSRSPDNPISHQQKTPLWPATVACETEANRLEALGATRAYRVEPDMATMASGFITMDYRRMVGRRWQPMKPPADLAFDSQNGWSSSDVC